MKEYIVQAISQETIASFDAHNAPELIRCKDCKHCDDIDMYGYVQCDKAETHEPNFYCADGERKE